MLGRTSSLEKAELLSVEDKVISCTSFFFFQINVLYIMLSKQLFQQLR